jgi:DNA-binding GntR family transcriptional regulator
MIDSVHTQFINAVAGGRKMDEAKVRTIADGRVYSGEQAHAIGLVDQLGHRGALVRSFTPDECRNVFLVRAELEALAAERSAGRLDEGDLRDLEHAQALLRVGYERHRALPPGAEAERAVICEQWSQANELFHNVILAAADCPPLRETVQSLQNRVPRSLAWHTFAADPEIIPRSVAGHERILEALLAPDPPAARALLRVHVVETGETLAHWLERQDARRNG